MPPAAATSAGAAAAAASAAVQEATAHAQQEPFEVVLVTGGSGFLGQHVVRLLHERDASVKEIRVLDLKPYVNTLGYKEQKPCRSWVGDVRDVEALAVQEAFAGAHCVIHCAGLVSYRFPAHADADLHESNVEGARGAVAQCVRAGVERLVFCSCASVTLTPYLRGSFCVSVLVTEARAPPPAAAVAAAALLDEGHAAAALRAEQAVLAADGTPLPQGGQLRTVALRPTPLYGERDPRLVPSLVRAARFFQGVLPRLAGPGGKHQLTYVGNAAWAHLCAKDALRSRPDAAGGLPVFVTDDTPPEDLLEWAARAAGEARARPSAWALPPPVGFLAATLLEGAARALGVRLPASPRAVARYLASVVCYDRLRAALRLHYAPIYTPDEAFKRARTYYCDTKM